MKIKKHTRKTINEREMVVNSNISEISKNSLQILQQFIGQFLAEEVKGQIVKKVGDKGLI